MRVSRMVLWAVVVRYSAVFVLFVSSWFLAAPSARIMGVRPMTTNRWLLRVLQVVTILVAAAMLSLPLRSERLLVNKPLTEDGYYAFTVARNIALGRGITADGHHRTNGFQPLQTFLTVPAFFVSGGNRILPIRMILALHWLVVLATASLLALIARDLMPSEDTRARALIPWVTALIYLASVPVLLNAFNGLETGLLLLCLAAAWRFHQARGLDSSLNRLLFGALLGVTVLARIDAVFLVLAFAFYCLFYDVSLPLLRRLLAALQVGVPAVVVSGPWWLYNLIGFGSLVPTSGLAQQQWEVSGGRILTALHHVSELAMPFLYVPHMSPANSLIIDLVRIAATVAVGVILWRSWEDVFPEGDEPRRARAFTYAGCLLAATLTLIVWYTGSSWAAHFYRRYFAPLSVLTTVALAVAAFRLCVRDPRAAAVAASLVALPAVAAVLALNGRLPGRLGGGFADTGYQNQVALVEKHVPAGEWVGAPQSGTLGYFRDNVLNLDGKLNPEARPYRRRLREYLNLRGVRWWCDWPPVTNNFLGSDRELYGWVDVDHSGGFILCHFELEPLGDPP